MFVVKYYGIFYNGVKAKEKVLEMFSKTFDLKFGRIE
jgi:hypothetical protein